MKRYLSLLITTWLLHSYIALAAPITFNTALPVSQGEYIVREQLVVNQSSDDPSDLDRDRRASSIVSTLVYGVTPDFAIFGSIPYTNRRLETNADTRDTSGIGDSRLFGRYTLYADDFKGGTFRIAPFAGIKLPTGDNNEKDSLGKLPMRVQTGTGSWDFFGGLVATYATTDWELDGQISYQKNTESDKFQAGDIVRADASLQYRLAPSVLTADTTSFINGVLEANLIHQNNHEINGINNRNSGGITLFLVPGLQYATERYIVEIGIQIPVIQNLNGMALENNYIARTGFRINF